MKNFVVYFGFLLISLIAIGQDTVVYDAHYSQEYMDRSTRFAWTTLGLGGIQLGGGTAEFVNQSNQRSIANFQGATQGRVTIGGIHFWGHADFYVTFPLSFLTFMNRPAEFDRFLYTQGIETGARYYPWAIRTGKIRPFAGASLRSFSFGFEPEGAGFALGRPLYQKFSVPIEFGLTYATQNTLFSAGIYLHTTQSIDYAISETRSGVVDFDPYSLRLEVMRYMDLDALARKPAAITRINKKHDVLEEANRLSAFYIGLGPSSSIQTGDNPWLVDRYPHLSKDNLSSFNLDITAGYFFEKPDMNIGFSYRGMQSGSSGINDRLSTQRRSYMIEGYKFLFNYLGFVPFIGITGSLEQLQTTINDESWSTTKPAVGVIFGWDIRVVKTENSLLRTNLRYIPNLHMDIDGDRMFFDHLEFNFIQYVRFIGRKKFLSTKGY